MVHRRRKTEKQNLSMAAENCVICLIDRLWFHQIILSSEPSLLHFPQHPKNTSQMTSSVITTVSQDESSSQESDDDDDDDDEERPNCRLLNLVPIKTRFHSSSPISSRNPRKRILQKTMSCKSLVDLELEEIKGFMDLGFIFRKDKLSKGIVNLIPGLQRIDDEGDEEEKAVTRPYLSEAWIVRRLDSPLLDLRIPRVSTNADMKKHLKYWAQTVASAIHQQSI